MCATACFDISYKVGLSNICDDEGDAAQQKYQRFLPPVSEDVWRGMTYC